MTTTDAMPGGGAACWTAARPDRCGYYYALHRDRDTWLDCSPEVVYVFTYDGFRLCVLRPGETKAARLEEFTHWCGPLPAPPPPPEPFPSPDASRQEPTP